MHYAVVVVMPKIEQTQNVFDKPGAYQAFLDAVSKTNTKTDSSLEAISNLWLLPLPNETPALAAIVSAAERHQIPYRVLYFDHLPLEYSYIPPKS